MLFQLVNLCLQLVLRIIDLREPRVAAIELLSQRLFGCLEFPAALLAHFMLFLDLLLLLCSLLQLFLQTQHLLLIVNKLLSRLTDLHLLLIPCIVCFYQLRVLAIKSAAQLVEFCLLLISRCVCCPLSFLKLCLFPNSLLQLFLQRCCLSLGVR